MSCFYQTVRYSVALIDVTYVTAGSLGAEANNDPAMEAAIELWIDEASARIEAACNQPIEQTTKTDYVFSGTGLPTYRFGFFPVTALTKLEYKTGFGSSATWTVIPATDYELVTTEGYYIQYPAGFGKGVANYRMTFTHGYAAGNIPNDIKGVAREMVAKLFNDFMGKGGKAWFGKSGTSQSPPGGGSLNTTLKDLEPAWALVLSDYTVRNVRR